MDGDWRSGILCERPQVGRVLAEDGVHERIKEQVRAVYAEEMQQVLHPRSRSASE
jgi:hypothetical protein